MQDIVIQEDASKLIANCDEFRFSLQYPNSNPALDVHETAIMDVLQRIMRVLILPRHRQYPLRPNRIPCQRRCPALPGRQENGQTLLIQLAPQHKLAQGQEKAREFKK